jgi:type IV pilus assembly protein PilA
MSDRYDARSVQMGFTLIELMIVVTVIGVLAAVAIPQYQTYVYKSQVQRVVGEAGSLKQAVELCILSGRTDVGNPSLSDKCDPQASGSNLQATAGNAAPSVEAIWSAAGTGVPQVSLSTTAVSTVVATFGNTAALPLQTPTPGTITWSREPNGSWSCRAAHIAPKYASPACPL